MMSLKDPKSAGKWTQQDADLRRAEVLKMSRSGMTKVQIAAVLAVSAERVRQIIYMAERRERERARKECSDT